MIESTKFFNSRKFNSETLRYSYDSEFIDLVRKIEAAAEANGLSLSRWQANKSGRNVTISYALHTGERAGQFRHMDDNAIIDHCILTALEGTTRRCAAYKELAAMAEEWLGDDTGWAMWGVDEWLSTPRDYVSPEMTDSDIESEAETIINDAKNEGVVISGDVAEFLRNTRDEILEELEVV